VWIRNFPPPPYSYPTVRICYYPLVSQDAHATSVPISPAHINDAAWPSNQTADVRGPEPRPAVELPILPDIAPEEPSSTAP
jgi:hypothetical protein